MDIRADGQLIDEGNIPETEVLEQLTEEDVSVNSSVSIVEDSISNPNVLAVIEGVFMEINSENGNTRLYLPETIEKKILKNEYVINMMANKCLLGEAHHPETRTSIWMNHAAMCTTKLWMDPTGKFLMGRADILNTPTGRIVYTLLKYGCKIGVSARANGKGVKRGKLLVIKPENYFFKCFDLVLNPGFSKARPTAYEADGVTPINEEGQVSIEEKIYEEFKSMAENNTLDKEMARTIIEYSESDKLKELIPILEESTDSGEPTELLGDSKLQEKCDKLEKEKEEMNESVKELETLVHLFEEEKEGYLKQITSLTEENERLSLEVTRVKEKVAIGSDLVEMMTEEVSELERIPSSLKEESDEMIRELLEELAEKNEMLKASESKVKKLTEEVTRLRGIATESLKETQSLLEEEQVPEIPVSKTPEKKKEVKPLNEGIFASGSFTVLNEEQKEVYETRNTRQSLIKSVGGN